MANLTWLFEEGNADSALFAMIAFLSAKPTALKNAIATEHNLCSVYGLATSFIFEL